MMAYSYGSITKRRIPVIGAPSTLPSGDLKN